MRHPSFSHWSSSRLVLLIWVLLVSFPGKVQAQERVSSFPEDSKLYFSTLEQHFNFVNKNRKKEAISFLQSFREKWNSPFFSDEIKSQIYLISNKMLDNKMSAIPFFSDYFKTLIHLLEENDNESALAWIKATQYILESKNYREFSSFIRTSDDFFTKNLVFYDRILKWKVNTNEYSVSFNNDTLKYIFPQTDLVCYSKNDSSNILNTQGIFYPLTNTWEGQGGKIGWTRADYPIDSVYAELNKYSIPLRYSKFKADSVQFHHHYYFDNPIEGKLEEQVLASRRGRKAVFPKFTSYEKRWEISDIFPNIDFIGGIFVEGAQLLGFGDESSPASLIISRNDTAFVKLRSKSFSIQPDQIRSEYSSVSIKYKNDSIYHSGLRMNYTSKNQLLSFIRDNHGLTANPFYNTYHQIDMYVEAVYWKMDENLISFDMTMGRTKSPAHFESFNYFSEYRYNRLQGIDISNPLTDLKRYCDENMSKIIYFDEYAEYLELPVEQIQLLLLNLAHQGFLLYDATNGQAVLGDKVDFYLQAYAGEVDSDVIRFESRPARNEANAYLQIDNFDLQINGLDRIILSDSQNLIIEPTNRSIKLGKNKDFNFDGKITAGRLSFATTNSSFNYNEFKLDMPSIDSLWFWVNGDPLPNGGFERKYVQTAIKDLSGDLLIDHPDNKSGFEARNEYPIFNSNKDSYVYYNTANIQNGVYTKDRFYFHVNPFNLTSLNNFSTDDIAFEGYLASGGIFPDISQALSVQEDYSLGFTKELPPEGIMAYGDKGRFYKEINLSNEGLKGNGELSFINSVTSSEDFVFLPDSMNVYAQTFELKPTTSPVEFPRVNGSNTYQQWLPYKETMRISSTDESISIYDDETSMDGTLLLRPSSLSGKGEIHFKVAKLISDSYVFKNQTFDAKTSNFSDEGMRLNNFSAHTDYTQRHIVFSSNDGSSKVDFPENSYICYMDEAKWYMDEAVTEYASSFKDEQNQFGDFTLRQLADKEYKGSDFISTHPGQDSLSFISTNAKFNAKEKTIEAEGVHYIKVADAVIFPEGNKVTILKDANMVPLANSKIITNAITKYHEIDNAIVKVEGRKSYSGSGDYIYIDKKQQRHPIHFKEIKVDSSYQTVARGEIFAQDNFALSPEFYFRGIAKLEASRKLLGFDGGFRIESNCVPEQNWIKFSSVIDPENIKIPIEVQPVVPDVSRKPKYVGILNSAARQKNYAAFLSNRIDYYDSLILTASGFIMYDEISREYRISSEEKLSQLARPDNYFSLKKQDCSTYGEGKINLDVKFLDLSIESYGNIQAKDSVANIRLGAGIDFHFSDDALKHISDQFAASIATQKADNSSSYYSKMIAGFLGMDDAEKYISRQLMGNQRRIPDGLLHTIFLNDLHLRWDANQSSYVSNGLIGIGNLNKYRINAMTKGKVEVKKSRAGDELTIYFEINNHWYFFKYSNNVMQVLSSNEVFNNIIQSDMDAKGEKNRLKQDKVTGKRSSYRYVLSRIDEKEDFLKRLKTD